MSSPSVHRRPNPNDRLRYFYPFVDWALFAMNMRIADRGVENPKRVLDSTVFRSPSMRMSIPDEINYALQLSVIKRVVKQAEWLTWSEYLELVIASDCGGYKQRCGALSD
jgi:hypothetical protein